MADPDITVHDEFGAEITAGFPLALPTAIPNTPTTPDLLISVRNNDVDAGPVDSSFDTVISLTGRLAGSVAEPTADALVYLTSRALQFQVISVSGGATSQIRSYVPVGTGAPLILGEIPDGGIVNLGLRVLANLAATIQDVEIFIAVESRQSTALPIGSYERDGNFIYDGDPGGGGVPDKTFTQILSKTGALDPGAFDDTIDTWTEIEYTLEGVPFTTIPAPATLTFDDLDGDTVPVALAAGQEYIAGIFLDGSNVFVIVKSVLGTAPLLESARPATPSGTTPAGYVTVPFGLAIDTVVDVLVIGFFGIANINGLDVTFGGGTAAVANRFNVRQTQTLVSLPDDTPVVEVYVRPDIGMEAIVPPAGPTDPKAMIVRTIETLAGAVVLPTTDERRIGAMTVLNGPVFALPPVYGAMVFSDPTGGGPPQIVLDDTTWVGWTDAITFKLSGGMLADPLDATSANFTVPETGTYDSEFSINGFIGDVNRTVEAKLFVDDAEPAEIARFSLPNVTPTIVTSTRPTNLIEGETIDARFKLQTGDNPSDITLIAVSWQLTMVAE